MNTSMIQNFEAILKAHLTANNNDTVTAEFILDYSTDISFVLKFLVTINQNSFNVFIKSDKSQNGLLLEEYNNLSNFKEFHFDSKTFQFPEIIMFSQEDNILALEECQGDLFLDYINQDCKWLSLEKSLRVSSSAKHLGKWLSYIEKKTIKNTPLTDIKRNLIAEYEEYSINLTTNQTISAINKLHLQCKDLLFKNLDYLNTPVSTYLSHGDFHPGNFFISGEKVTAIDFQHSKTRLVGYDALYFDMNLTLSFGIIKFKPNMINNIRLGFEQGYKHNTSNNFNYIEIIKSLIVLRALVYLNSVCVHNKGLSRVSVHIDIKKLHSWLTN